LRVPDASADSFAAKVPPPCRRLAAVRRPRYIESGFPLIRALSQRALSALPQGAAGESNSQPAESE